MVRPTQSHISRVLGWRQTSKGWNVHVSSVTSGVGPFVTKAYFTKDLNTSSDSKANEALLE